MELLGGIREAQTNLLDHLAEYEAAVSNLYEAYGEAFSGMADFWRGLALAERAHAAVLSALRESLDKGHYYYGLDGFDQRALTVGRSLVECARSALQEGRVTVQTALEAALEIEAYVLDGGFFTDAKSDYPAFAIIAEHLVKEDERHSEQLRRRYAELRMSGRAAD